MEDVIIVGAGPSGCSLANLVSKQGFKVTVFDRLPNETTRFCGEFISVPDAEECTQIKFSKDLILNKYKESRLIFPDAKKEVSIPTKHLYLVNTQLLKTKLRKKAESQGAKFIFNKKVSGIIKDHGIVNGVKAYGRKYFSKIVAVCDGANSALARLIGFNCSNNKALPGFRWKFKNCRNLDVNSANFYFYEKLGIGYAWLYPFSKTKCNVGIGSATPKYMHKVFKNLIKNEPGLKNAKPYHKGAGTITYTGILPKLSCPGCVLAGESGGQIHSLIGGGINGTLFASKIAAEAVITALNENSYATGGLSKYDILYKRSRDGVIIQKSTKDLLRTIALHQRKNIIALLSKIINIVDIKIIKKGAIGTLNTIDKLKVFLKHPVTFTKLMLEILTKPNPRT